eukprot:TRINITY_DN5343_c0_g1_i1.p1 TRINITY_DN5343_c0_g1~~TRINITY_DN5343_c0_g1_i1.p1  ORF type:complete len:593 (+),score=98.98 TRINITY_DN5343_c0_g1_i1:189-1967(+)
MAARTFLHLSITSSSSSYLFLAPRNVCPCSRILLSSTRGRRTLPFRPRSPRCAYSAATVSSERVKSFGATSLLEKLRERFSGESSEDPPKKKNAKTSPKGNANAKLVKKVSSFRELGLSDEIISALEELNISEPTEVQCLGISAILNGESIVLASHTGSGKTLAYMLPLIQLLREDEAKKGMQMKPKRPRAVVLCPTRELCEQVFRVAKSISHHARFRSTMISGGVRMRPQTDALNNPIEMVVGTPGRLLDHIKEGNMFYGDIKYVVIDEADTMFDHGFGPDLRKFLSPLRNLASELRSSGFQSILVTATITKAVQKLLDEEFHGIQHMHTSTLHKKISTARHEFIKLSPTENKLEALLQVLEPSLAKGNKAMVFCNTLDSSRAVDHYLNENQLLTVNYHGEVPAEKRFENLKRFKSNDGDCPTLVCTDLAARGLDLAVDHVIMFDFPLNSIDYLHRTGRTARMGAKGKVTSLVSKKDVLLSSKIEDALKRNDSLESISVHKDKPQARKQDNTKSKGSPKSRIQQSSKLTRNIKSVNAKTLLKKSKSGTAQKRKLAVKISKTKKERSLKDAHNQFQNSEDRKAINHFQRDKI